MKNVNSLLKFSCYLLICLNISIINSSITTTEHIIEDISTVGEENRENKNKELLQQVDFEIKEENSYNLKNSNSTTINISREIKNKESISSFKPSTNILKHKIALLPAKCLLEYHSGVEDINLKSIDYNNQKKQLQDLNEKSKLHSLYNSEQLPFTSDIQPSQTLPTITYITKIPDENLKIASRKDIQNHEEITNVSNEETNNLALKQTLSMYTTNLPSINNALYSYRRFSIQDDNKNFETSTIKIPEISTQSEQYDLDEQPEPLYEQKMKFVIPYPLKVSTALSNYPWEIDQYAYYPSHLRPAYMNIPIPYFPTYHLIRTLTIPNDTA